MFAPSGIAAIGQINEALQEGDSMKTLAMLQNPAAKLSEVEPSVAQHYHDKLLEARREKAHVRLPAPCFVYPLVRAPLGKTSCKQLEVTVTHRS